MQDKIDSDTLEDIDARPSDAIALSIKNFNAPIFVAAKYS